MRLYSQSVDAADGAPRSASREASLDGRNAFNDMLSAIDDIAQPAPGAPPPNAATDARLSSVDRALVDARIAHCEHLRDTRGVVV